MTWLNYHHLLYFWTVVREGSVSAAGRKLHLAQPTVSGQIKELERQCAELEAQLAARGAGSDGTQQLGQPRTGLQGVQLRPEHERFALRYRSWQSPRGSRLVAAAPCRIRTTG